jgi:hypothetical protein
MVSQQSPTFSNETSYVEQEMIDTAIERSIQESNIELCGPVWYVSVHLTFIELYLHFIVVM